MHKCACSPPTVLLSKRTVSCLRDLDAHAADLSLRGAGPGTTATREGAAQVVTVAAAAIRVSPAADAHRATWDMHATSTGVGYDVVFLGQRVCKAHGTAARARVTRRRYWMGGRNKVRKLVSHKEKQSRSPRRASMLTTAMLEFCLKEATVALPREVSVTTTFQPQDTEDAPACSEPSSLYMDCACMCVVCGGQCHLFQTILAHGLRTIP